MKIAIMTNDAQKEELLTEAMPDGLSVEYLHEPVAVEGTECYIDLLFEPSDERKNKLKQLQPAVIIVNAVTTTLADLPGNFVRINGWPSFLKRKITEASCTNDEIRIKAEKILSCFDKKTEWVSDVPGFVTARVVSMVINEAYLALEERVSSKEEIDIAMKLGTNYPYGPFEWSKKIGIKNIYELLQSLSVQNSRYEPASLLKQEALQS